MLPSLAVVMALACELGNTIEHPLAATVAEIAQQQAVDEQVVERAPVSFAAWIIRTMMSPIAPAPP